MSSLDDTSRNKELIRTFHRRLWVERDLGVLDELIAPAAVMHWGDSDSNAVDAVRADVERYFAAFSEVHTSIDDLIGEDDKVVLRWTTTGVHTGRYGKVMPTGRAVTMSGVDVYRLDNGRIVEGWSMWDALGAYRQLGLVDPDVGPG
jgi:predicted ester cyclase